MTSVHIIQTTRISQTQSFHKNSKAPQGWLYVQKFGVMGKGAENWYFSSLTAPAGEVWAALATGLPRQNG